MYEPDEECRKMISVLEKLCEKKSISPHALAKKAGISTSTMSYIMNGKTKPQVYTVLQLCNALDVRMSDLFDSRNEEPQAAEYLTYKEKELLDSYRLFSDRKKELLRIYIDMLQSYED